MRKVIKLCHVLLPNPKKIQAGKSLQTRQIEGM